MNKVLILEINGYRGRQRQGRGESLNEACMHAMRIVLNHVACEISPQVQLVVAKHAATCGTAPDSVPPIKLPNVVTLIKARGGPFIPYLPLRVN